MKITLCGSTKFMDAFGEWNVRLTKAGYVVYSVATSSHGDYVPNEEEKRRLDLVHLRKIQESDGILVLNVTGYYGDSTRREIEWASMLEKTIYWLEPPTFDNLGISDLDDLFTGGRLTAP